MNLKMKNKYYTIKSFDRETVELLLSRQLAQGAKVVSKKRTFYGKYIIKFYFPSDFKNN